MTDGPDVHALLGHPGPDPGCVACFDVMDQVAESQAAGEDWAARLPAVAHHVRDCAACREDLDGLRRALG